MEYIQVWRKLKGRRRRRRRRNESISQTWVMIITLHPHNISPIYSTMQHTYMRRCTVYTGAYIQDTNRRADLVKLLLLLLNCGWRRTKTIVVVNDSTRNYVCLCMTNRLPAPCSYTSTDACIHKTAIRTATTPWKTLTFRGSFWLQLLALLPTHIFKVLSTVMVYGILDIYSGGHCDRI